MAGMTVRDVVAGFPVGILIRVAGVTYFFGIAQLNGTIDRDGRNAGAHCEPSGLFRGSPPGSAGNKAPVAGLEQAADQAGAHIARGAGDQDAGMLRLGRRGGGWFHSKDDAANTAARFRAAVSQLRAVLK